MKCREYMEEFVKPLLESMISHDLEAYCERHAGNLELCNWHSGQAEAYRTAASLVAGMWTAWEKGGS